MPTAVPRPADTLSASARPGGSWENWPRARVIVLSTLGSAVLSLCFFAPRFWLWPLAGLPLNELIAIQPEIHRAFHALQQLQDPWLRVDDAVNRVIEWRLLWPLIGHALGFSPGVYFSLPFMGAVGALAAVSSIVWRATRHPLPTFSAALLVATSSWYFVSTGWLAYFDSWLIWALLLTAFASSRWTLFAAALLAPWIDERFVLAAPLCLAVRSLGLHDPANAARNLGRDVLVVFAGILPYLAIRFGAEISGTRATSASYWSHRSLLPAPVHAMIWGLWNGLRLGWVVVALALLVAPRGGKGGGTLWVIGATLLVNVCVADDISRSTSVLVPGLVVAVLVFWRDARPRAQRLLPLFCLGNLVLPAQHVIAAPVGDSVAFHTVPILGADAEFERGRNPPDFANSATYTRRSLDHLQGQLIPRALAAAEIAVRLDPASGKALANRAIIYYVNGRQAEGLADLDRALQLSPELYDARIQRAAFRQQAGDLRGAHADVSQALRDMPADWPRRAEARQFERTLAAQVSR